MVLKVSEPNFLSGCDIIYFFSTCTFEQNFRQFLHLICVCCALSPLRCTPLAVACRPDGRDGFWEEHWTGHRCVGGRSARVRRHAVRRGDFHVQRADRVQRVVAREITSSVQLKDSAELERVQMLKEQYSQRIGELELQLDSMERLCGEMEEFLEELNLKRQQRKPAGGT
ncbi:Bli1p KNAG_0A07200 [Huiozyma naganishii CBS 8797]|uniref:Biogenesis of lysosome-related organelles complex 1 subunit BLI1 n=1 Tax=Huiozyma naganishii (strain ATCC MYA-139 / BCRC 22969 / CBS 8797 / KCTC 17520 / NBRC 10181 / NCYC 3082 / Yp74L-3) TaxID=1071383 RepID=J7RFQ3_HUIN7|nr:hypothetical protein KNAG_0A07200 [Kazachstania naganishii CBS 8797]CCK68373.1 hypothetical protein KNAG_0A07200 [Kazachstania naganishii CBS 8797]